MQACPRPKQIRQLKKEVLSPMIQRRPSSTNFKSLILVAISALTFGNITWAKETEKKQTPELDYSEIINGNDGSTSLYPWIAFIADESDFQYCGASLISPTWVLTAAHCFLNEAGNAVDIPAAATSTIVLNSDSSDPFAAAAIVGQIGQIIVHPLYKPDRDTSENSDDYDIALVELSAAVDLQPVSLLSKQAPEIPESTIARIMGWGATAVDSNNEAIDASSTLLTATQRMTSRESCAAIYEGLITDNMICASGLDSNDTTDTCQGDSGGPLTIAKGNSFIQVGIVSFGGTETGPTCGDPDAPGVYASVSALADFILDHATEVTFTTLEEANSAPVLSTSITGTTVTLSWTAYAGASSYKLYYAPFPAQTPVESLDVGADTSLSAALPAGSKFYVAIQPITADGPIDVFSNIANFAVPN